MQLKNSHDFLIEFNTYNISEYDPISLNTSLLHESHLNHHSSSKMLDINTQMFNFKPRGTILNTNNCSFIPRFTFFNVYEQISLVLQVGRSVQEWGKQHRIITRNALIIKFPNKSWASFGCQMNSRWFSAPPKASQEFLWNLIITAILVMILCRLHYSCTICPNWKNNPVNYIYKQWTSWDCSNTGGLKASHYFNTWYYSINCFNIKNHLNII